MLRLVYDGFMDITEIREKMCRAMAMHADYTAIPHHDIAELLDAFDEAIELLKESYAGRPPDGRVFMQAITEHHERIGAFLDKHVGHTDECITKRPILAQYRGDDDPRCDCGYDKDKERWGKR